MLVHCTLMVPFVNGSRAKCRRIPQVRTTTRTRLGEARDPIKYWQRESDMVLSADVRLEFSRFCFSELLTQK